MVKLVLSLYIFLSVNDLILYAFNLVQLKNLLLVLTVLVIFFGSGFWQKRQIRVFYFMVPLVCIAFMIGMVNGVATISIFQQSFSVVVAILIPVMVARFAGEDENNWRFVSNLLMFSLIFMMLFKILYVLYSMGLLRSGILDLLFKNIAGRGELDGIERLNTGTQLILLYGLVLCITRLFAANSLQRLGYVVACLLFTLDLFIASSRYFTMVAPLAVVVTLIYGKIKVPKYVLILVGIGVSVAAGFLLQDMYSARVLTEDGGDSIRHDQTLALFEAFKNSPIFGHGAGYSVPSLTRNEDTPFMYEVQVVAFLMQYGIVGAVLYLAAMFQAVKHHIHGSSVILVIFYFAIFFAASYFNPYMLGSYAGLCMVAITVIVRSFSANKRGVNT
jgi:hypothetical protein